MVTVQHILLKDGLVIPQKHCIRVKPVFPIFDPQECNEVWSAGYKRKFLMVNKIYCHPLTNADSKSLLFVHRKRTLKGEPKVCKVIVYKCFKDLWNTQSNPL